MTTSEGIADTVTEPDPTSGILAQVRSSFGERFVDARVEAEHSAVDLLQRRAGDMDSAEATRLGQLFNTQEKAGRVRQDRFSPAFAGATMQMVTQELDRFNEVVADLWTAPVETALDTLGRIFGDRSVLPGAGSSLPSMLLYLRDPEMFGVCINATMRGLAAALDCQPFKAETRADYERFCAALRDWRVRHGVAPQEADAVLTALWRETRAERRTESLGPSFGDAPMRFLADLADNNNSAWMATNRDRYRDELRVPFATLLERIASRHMRELDPLLDTSVKTNRVLASIRKRFPDAHGEYYEYMWGAFSRGRKQEDIQLAVLVQPEELEASLFLGSATAEQVQRLRSAVEQRGDDLLRPLQAFADRVAWEIHGDRANPLGEPPRQAEVTDTAGVLAWLDAGGTSIKWSIPRGDPLLSDAGLADALGEYFRALHPLAAAAWGDTLLREPALETDDVASEPFDQPSLEDVASRCFLPAETLEEWVTALRTRMAQGLFYGPPGTGKTFVATQLARHLATSDEHVEMVQFHSSYSYEDFIEGLRPETVEDSGLLRYTVRPGLFQKICARARAAADETFVLVIDEMNRADVAAVFGELLLLLEYRGDRSVVLPYSQRPFTVPRNVILLGTMNTADRSLALVDFALRRRFNAFPLQPSADVLRGWAASQPDIDADLLLALFTLIRDRVGEDHPVAPGHSYWMVDDADAAALERIWSFQLKPYLAEHWFERPAELAQLERDVQALISEQS